MLGLIYSPPVADTPIFTLRDGTPFFGATVVGRTSEDSVFDGANPNPVHDPPRPGSRVAIPRPYEIPG